MPATNVRGGPDAGDMNAWWRVVESEMWVYDTRPEVGINAGAGPDPREYDAVHTDLSLRFARTPLNWRDHDLGNGQYGNYGWYDAVAQRANQLGMKPVFVLTVPDPASVPTGVSVADRAGAYARYAQWAADVARRYAPGSPYGTVNFLELFNEWEGTTFTDLFAADTSLRTQIGDYYGQMLCAAYPAIKAANSGVWVVMGGLGGGDTSQQQPVVQGVYAHVGGGLRARDCFDFLNTHSYGAPLYPITNTNPEQSRFVFVARDLNAVALQYGDAGRPVWNTEFSQQADDLFFAYGSYTSGCPGDALTNATWVDARQKEQLQWCLEQNARERLYTKCFVFAFRTSNTRDAHCPLPNGGGLQSGSGSDLYSYGLVDTDLSGGSWRKRPAYWYLGSAPSNPDVRTYPVRTTDVVFTSRRQLVPRGYTVDVTPQANPTVYEIRVHDVPVDSRFPTRIFFDVWNG